MFYWKPERSRKGGVSGGLGLLWFFLLIWLCLSLDLGQNIRPKE